MSTSGPPRFKDDPEVLRELGGDLSDEARLLSDHDLGALEAGLKGKIAAGATGAPSAVGASAVATGVVLALVVGGGAYLWLRAPSPEVNSATRVAESPRARKVLAAADESGSRLSAEEHRIADSNAVGDADSEPQPKLRVAGPEGTREEPSARDPLLPGGADVAGREPVVAVSARNPASALAIAPDSAQVGAPPALGPTPAPAGGPGDAPPVASSLAAELAEYDVGRRALRAGRFDEAAAAFEGYRTRFPAGRLRHEAAVGLLESRFRARQFAEARVIAAEVERGLLAALEDSPSADDARGARPASRRQRAEIWRLVGETYALTGACPEAERALKRARALSAEAAPDQVVESALDGCRRASR